MSGRFQPPPTWALPVIVDEVTGKVLFNPIWLKWFVDFSAQVGPGGAGSGQVISVNTKTGEVVLVASDVGAPTLAATNHWPMMQFFDGNIDTLSFFLAGGPTGGIGPKVDNESVLGAVGYRWKNIETYLLGLVGNFTWNGYAIVPPDGTTTSFLRKDGTWATPAGTGAQLNAANTWTALQTFNADLRTPTFGTVVGYGIAPTVHDTYVNGYATYRWLNTFTKDLTLGENLVWDAYTIPKPAGSTTTFLRNDGTWATPPTGVSLSVANTWTAKQTFSGGMESDGYTFVAGSGGQLAPKTNIISELGTTALRWLKAWFQDLDITGTFKWGTVNATAIPAPTGSTTTFLRNDGTWAAPANTSGTQQLGGIIKTTASSAITLGASFVSVTNYDTTTFTTSVGITTDLTAGSIKVSVAGNYIITLSLLCTYTSDVVSNRAFGIRLFDTTDSVAIINTTLSAPQYTSALSDSLTAHVTIPAARLNHPLILQVGNGNTFLTFAVGSATVSAVSVGPI